MAISAGDIKDLERAEFRLVGEHLHSAVKVCHWVKKSLLNKGFCYKQKFYGIQSHRCLQLTPSLPFCDHRCLFCWRNIELTSSKWIGEVDEPADILDAAISAHRLLVSGFGGNMKVDRSRFREAQNPKHCAISLAGEPTLYPKINELVEECQKRGLTSYLVTNGLHPDVLAKLTEPTQLYVSLVAPDHDIYKKICQPVSHDGWERLNSSLEVIPSFKCSKVIRLTLVKGLNLRDPDAYAKLIKRTDADFVEAKAYMFVGYSRSRLTMVNMPLHQDIKDFSVELSDEIGYDIVDESEESRVVLLKK